MKGNISRREFLKALALLYAGAQFPLHQLGPDRLQTGGDLPNIILILFDTWSAPHCSLYGYPRLTTPNLDRLAERATVFHRHYASGNYTLPGTASLLTGMLPWKHRAFDFPLDQIQANYKQTNLFRLFDQYNRLAYTHNPLAEFLLHTMLDDIDAYTPRYKLMLQGDTFINTVLKRDLDTANVAWLREVKPNNSSLNYSLFLSQLYYALQRRIRAPHEKNFPLGLPTTHQDNSFLLETGIDWAAEEAIRARQPFLGYFHFLPPHFPYRTRTDFFQRFHRDDYIHPQKPRHLFTQGVGEDTLEEQSLWYDEFILYVDAEFGRFYEKLQDAGMLDNTWIILTSDHGELFERGIRGHNTPTLFENLIHVPLMIFEPGQTSRKDVYENTGAVDILPTLMKISGMESQIPAGLDGKILPPYAGPEAPLTPDVYSVEAKNLKPNQPMTEGSAALLRENFKLIYYWGYPALGGIHEKIELFDLQADPLELKDLQSERPEVASAMLAEVKRQIALNDEPFSS